MPHQITTKWLGEMAFYSTNPSGHTLRIDAGTEVGGSGSGLHPKALMLSALAGCSGLDVISLLKKMKLEVTDFHIDTNAHVTEEHPKYYDAVTVEYHFYGTNLQEDKLQKAVNLSVEKYCGVMKMFRKFAQLKINAIFHHQ